MPKRKATTATGPKKKKPKSCPSADTPSTMPRCPVKTTSAASRFLAVPELRQLLFRSLDKTSLVCFARVEKALLSDVAAVLYETVDYGRARKKMRCDTPRGKVYCDAVRTVMLGPDYPTKNMLIDIERFDASPYGQPADLNIWERSILRAHSLLLRKLPNLRHMAWTDRDYITIEEDKTQGTVVGRACHLAPSEMEEEMEWTTYVATRPAPELEGYRRIITALDLIVPYTHAADSSDLRLPCGIPILESLETTGTVESLRSLFRHLETLSDCGMSAFTRLNKLSIKPAANMQQAQMSIADFPQLLAVIAKYIPNLEHLDMGLRWEDVRDEVMNWEPNPGSLCLKRLHVAFDYPPDPEEGAFNVMLHFAAIFDAGQGDDDDPDHELSIDWYGLARTWYERRPAYFLRCITEEFTRLSQGPMRYEALAKQDLYGMGIRRTSDLERLVFRPDGSALRFEGAVARDLLANVALLDVACDDGAMSALKIIANDATSDDALNDQLQYLKNRALDQAKGAGDARDHVGSELDSHGEDEDSWSKFSIGDEEEEDSCSECSGIETSELASLAEERRQNEEEVEEAEERLRVRWQAAVDAGVGDLDDSDEFRHSLALDDGPAVGAVMAFEALESFLLTGIIRDWRVDQGQRRSRYW